MDCKGISKEKMATSLVTSIVNVFHVSSRKICFSLKLLQFQFILETIGLKW